MIRSDLLARHFPPSVPELAFLTMDNENEISEAFTESIALQLTCSYTPFRCFLCLVP